jgi:hypothetical protein
LVGGEGFFEGFWGDGLVVEDDGYGHVRFCCDVGVAFREFEISEEDSRLPIERAFGLEANRLVEGLSRRLFVPGGDERATFDEEAFGANGRFLGFLKEVIDGLDGWTVVTGFHLGLGEEEPICRTYILIF